MSEVFLSIWEVLGFDPAHGLVIALLVLATNVLSGLFATAAVVL